MVWSHNSRLICTVFIVLVSILIEQRNKSMEPWTNIRDWLGWRTTTRSIISSLPKSIVIVRRDSNSWAESIRVCTWDWVSMLAVWSSLSLHSSMMYWKTWTKRLITSQRIISILKSILRLNWAKRPKSFFSLWTRRQSSQSFSTKYFCM